MGASPMWLPGTDAAGAYGTFSLDAQGHWTYTADNGQQAVQALQADGMPLTDALTLTSVDGTTHDITVTIEGSNDGPTVSYGDLGGIDQEQPHNFTSSDLLQAVHTTDIDTGDHLDIQSVSVDPQYGSFSQGAGGIWDFRPADGVSHENIPVQITVRDGAGAMNTASADLDIAPLPQGAKVQGVGMQNLTGSISELTGGWSIEPHGGSSVVTLAVKYRSLTIDPQTGQFEYGTTRIPASSSKGAAMRRRASIPIPSPSCGMIRS